MTDNVVDFPQKTTKNRGNFFAIDRRVWATVCKARDINQGVAYLILARGTGPDHRSTGWSANAIEDRTGISRGLAKKAIADLVERGVVKDNGKHEGRGRYELLPPLEIPGCVVSGQALTVAEIALLKMLKDGAPKRIPKEVRKKSAFADVGLYPLKVALSLLDKGILRRVGPAKDQSFQVTGKAATIAMIDGAVPEMIWLPNTLVDSATGETAPIERVRQSHNSAALRLLVDLYHAQTLADCGGVHWRQFRRQYEREKIGEHAGFTIWGFRSAEQHQAWPVPFVAPHLTGNGRTRDAGWAVFWEAIRLLKRLGLIYYVAHLIDADSEQGSVIHPFPVDGDGEEPGEYAIVDAAREAAEELITEGQVYRATACEGFSLVPLAAQIKGVQLVGLLRLRYRAHTAATAAWFAQAEEWQEWVRTYNALRDDVGARSMRRAAAANERF